MWSGFLWNDPQARRRVEMGPSGAGKLGILLRYFQKSPISATSADMTGTRSCGPLDTRSTDMCATSLRCPLIGIKISTAELIPEAREGAEDNGAIALRQTV